MSPPRTEIEPISAPERIVPLRSKSPVLASVPAMHEPPMLMLSMRPADSMNPERSSVAAPPMLPPMKSCPIRTAPRLPAAIIAPVTSAAPLPSEPPTSEPPIDTLAMRPPERRTPDSFPVPPSRS